MNFLGSNITNLIVFSGILFSGCCFYVQNLPSVMLSRLAIFLSVHHCYLSHSSDCFLNPLPFFWSDKTYGKANKRYHGHSACRLHMAWIFSRWYLLALLLHSYFALQLMLYIHTDGYPAYAADYNYGAVLSLWAPVILVCLLPSLSNFFLIFHIIF